jgi:hypothetical protein
MLEVSKGFDFTGPHQRKGGYRAYCVSIFLGRFLLKFTFGKSAK